MANKLRSITNSHGNSNCCSDLDGSGPADTPRPGEFQKHDPNRRETEGRCIAPALMGDLFFEKQISLISQLPGEGAKSAQNAERRKQTLRRSCRALGTTPPGAQNQFCRYTIRICGMLWPAVSGAKKW